ncbi:hypothetical protein CC85DRAFT_454 [Cutaneotrichosporon oleaginosum]|uniref:SCP domain-containing protein n=1 Tax=Cutaneotrichosporon oleaginosum TaxID=879819 RepID=A0A0J0XZ61_9TREE|nr:uncharacterized protein CC85DRAFT_454 [Cutaneotrichosporon oleaginosum]KLT46343.1 hypothetical protein CC85DRAFT_454 [Cutaneotrichosporon oleaginosum]TXT15285.1 hypothetical protein COLE_01478 [Cutaneotrichosporon oleaginosum]
MSASSKGQTDGRGFDNLAQQSARNLPLNYGVDSFLDMWADEWPQTFAGGDPVNGRVVVLNHLTQMVWKSDTVVGCSWNVDCTEPGMDHSVFLSCVYGPGGNVVGQQDQEVGNYIPS